MWQCLAISCNVSQHTATHCNTLQHTATHCNILQHTAIYKNDTHNTIYQNNTHNTCNVLYCLATHCNTLQHTATHTTQYTKTTHTTLAMSCNVLQCVKSQSYCMKLLYKTTLLRIFISGVQTRPSSRIFAISVMKILERQTNYMKLLWMLTLWNCCECWLLRILSVGCEQGQSHGHLLTHSWKFSEARVTVVNDCGIWLFRMFISGVWL